MLDTYETMAKTAEMNGDKKSATAFTERALHLKGWIETNSANKSSRCVRASCGAGVSPADPKANAG